MNFNSTFSNPSFKGRREDLKNIKSLSENNMPILENKKQLILSAIDNVGKTGDKEDIEMLMGTVETMKYGIKNNSEFAKALGGTNGEKENTDWDGILQSTVRAAIDTTDGEDKAALEARFQKVFGEEKPLTEQEKNMLQLRSDILTSKEMTNVLDDPDKTFEAARIRQNLDYFIGSSEINNDDKEKCLGYMKHFLSDDYEINPQLKDHKVQAFSEMLNDLIIKRPDEEVYTIKDVSQKQTGMCAAISIARKTTTYEDKVRAMEIMMAELDNKPTMKVYDRTQLGTGKMVEITKAPVDFQDGMKKGYRIVDTGTHQWMNAANYVGDGRIEEGHYQAFDAENFEIFRDAHWNNDLQGEGKAPQTWLRYLSKESGAVSKAMKRNESIAKVQREIGEFKAEYQERATKADAAIRKTLQTISPELDDAKATQLTKQILKADSQKDKALKLVDGEPASVSQKKLAALIQKELPNAKMETIDANIEKIAGLRKISNDANAALDKLTAHKAPKAIFAYNKNLFLAAAHHRRSVEAELQVPERLSAYEKALNIPVREGMLNDSANKILNNLNSKAVVDRAAENFNVDANATSVKVAVENAVLKSENELPARLDTVLEKMGMGNRETVVTGFLNDFETKIQSGDKQVLQTFAENAHIRPDAQLALKKIETAKATLVDNPSNKQIAEAVNMLGYGTQAEMVGDMFKTFDEMTADMSKDQLKELLGNNPDKALADLGKEISSVSREQAQIERQLNMPTRQEVVLNVLEATKKVLPEKTLEEMQAKFDKVAEMKSADDNRIVDPSVKKPKVPDSAYLFTQEEKEMYAGIEAQLPQMKAYAKFNAKAVEKALAPQLKEVAAERGRLMGNLWVSKEGESGLADDQSIRLLEMIMGKKYHNESDIDKVVAHIKEGNGSGTSSTHVSHTEYSGHAQYVVEVSPVEVIDPKTKQVVMKDVLYHDNTWGRAEDEGTFTDETGVTRTNYGNGYGGPNGYVYNKHLFNGVMVEEQKFIPGQLKSGEKYDMWRATRISGENSKAQSSIKRVLDDIIDLGNSEQKIQEFEQTLRSGAPVNIEEMENLEKSASKTPERYKKIIENGNFTTQEQIDSLKDNKLKMLLEKTALRMSVPNSETENIIVNQMDSERIFELRNKLPDIQKAVIAGKFGKSAQAVKQITAGVQDEIIGAFESAYAGVQPTENLQEIFNGLLEVSPEKYDGSLSSLKSALLENTAEKLSASISDKKIAKNLTESISEIFSKQIDNMTIKTNDDINRVLGEDLGKVVTKYVDKKFNTSTDADLLAGMIKLQNMTEAEFEKFMADATPEDLGLKEVSSLDVAKEIVAQKDTATSKFEENSRYQTFIGEGPDDYSLGWTYRNMLNELSPLDNTVFVDKNAAGMAAKYGVTAAFPEARIMSKEEIQESVAGNLAGFRADVEAIKTSNNKAEDAAQLSAKVRAYVKANVVPNEQSMALGLMNNYIKAAKNSSANEAQALDKATEFLSEQHITAHPRELLKTFVKEVQSKNPDEATIATLREYLVAGHEMASNANIEYDMINNADEAFEGSMRSEVAEYQVKTADGRALTLDSDEGIEFVLDQLANPANGSTAVQVFFSQTALSERAVDVVANATNYAELSDTCKEWGNDFITKYKQVSMLEKGFADFSADNTVSYSTYKDAVKHYIKTLDKEYASVPAEEKEFYKAYKTFLQKTQNSDLVKNLSQEQIKPLLSKIHTMGIQTLSKGIMESAGQLNSLSQTLVNRMSAVEALKLPVNSDKAEAKAELLSQMEECYTQLEEIINKINEVVA